MSEDTNNKDLNLNDKEQVTLEKVDKTPFTIYGNEEKGYCVLMGKYRLSENIKNITLARKDAKRKDWERIMQVVWAVANEEIGQQLKINK